MRAKHKVMDWLCRLAAKVRQCLDCGYVWDLTSQRRCPNCKSTRTALVDKELA